MESVTPLYPLRHKNDFVFTSSPRDFVVEEIPLYPFSGEGEHLILHVRKKELTTWELIDLFCVHCGINRRDIGYAGLKDKHAMTIQYLSIPATCEAKLSSFSHEKVKILSITRHRNKLRIGHLKGNRFRIRLKKVLGVQKEMLDSVLAWIEAHGLPNYFGAQRFGTEGTNWIEGKKLLEKKRRMRDRKTAEFLMGAYQSRLFNAWLVKRMQISLLAESFSPAEIEKTLHLREGTLSGIEKQPHFFKLIEGEQMMHYPYGKLFTAENLDAEAVRFAARDIAPTGLIPGRKTKRAVAAAGEIERVYDETIALYGARRYAWIWPEEIETRYIPEKAHYELSFVLPKGSYATNLIDMLRGTAE